MMGDKASTKHGNMCLSHLYELAVAANYANVNAVIKNADGSVGYTRMKMPFDGSILAWNHCGDLPDSGTWTIAITKNTVPLEQTRSAVTEANQVWTANSPRAIQFVAGDTIGICHTTDSGFAATEGGDSLCSIYYLFFNS